jgi:hypothetical protein
MIGLRRVLFSVGARIDAACGVVEWSDGVPPDYEPIIAT